MVSLLGIQESYGLWDEQILNMQNEGIDQILLLLFLNKLDHYELDNLCMIDEL